MTMTSLAGTISKREAIDGRRRRRRQQRLNLGGLAHQQQA